MKQIMQKFKAGKGNVLLVALLLCASALIFFPSLEKESKGAMTSEEKRISAALSRIAGAGETQVAIYYAPQESGLGGGKNHPCGVLIVSEGAGDIAVKLDLMRAAQTLLGLPAGAVEVFAAEERK